VSNYFVGKHWFHYVAFRYHFSDLKKFYPSDICLLMKILLLFKAVLAVARALKRSGVTEQCLVATFIEAETIGTSADVGELLDLKTGQEFSDLSDDEKEELLAKLTFKWRSRASKALHRKRKEARERRAAGTATALDHDVLVGYDAYYEGCKLGGKLGGKVTGEKKAEAAKRKKSAISKGLAPDPNDEAVLAGNALGGKVAGEKSAEAAKRRRFVISKGLAPDPNDEAVLAGCDLGGKVTGDKKRRCKVQEVCHQ
jgi:hypothetical protein